MSFPLPSPLTLRAATEADAAFCRALFASTRDDLRQLPLPPPVLEQLIDMQRHAQETSWRMAFPHAAALILECDARPIGRLLLDASGRDWRVVDIALMPGERGRGHGGALLGAVRDQAQAAHASLALSVLRSNEAALRLYQRLGFTLARSDEMRHELLWQAGAEATPAR
ncbi:GNAT family N-acetyltransferase [Massilia solisilvae]|uniref:GNAT family N-acetyltransferase n=1 Tax=Massilia solisilvae TaxID=1811225 RepID=A0ABT2BLA8_9BURK|nr:GNAT family N-acetyltransferase [Massilia solisilvae]MCS0609297.1 GNAT family N-acetyltransferase [Massilia solisilvae]